jgi:hypothetical protein
LSKFGNTREAIQNALAHAYLGNTNTANFMDYGCPIDKSSGNASYIMATAVQMAKIRAAISAQRPPITAWLLLCYGPDVQAMNKGDKQRFLADTIKQEAFSGPSSIKTAGRLLEIAMTAVEDYRIGLLMGKELPVASYLEATGISPSNWARDWEPRRREALMILKRYDMDGVGRVSVVVKQIRESESK